MSGDIAIRALALGDSLKLPAPTFIVESKRYAEFEASNWRDYDPVLCVPPCQAFYVKPVSPIRVTAENRGHQELVNLAGFYAFTIRHGYWLIAELIDVDGKIAATETVAHLGSDQVWIPSEREEGSYVPFSICDPAVFDDDELPRVDCQRIARNLISFLYFCNTGTASMNKIVDPAPKNRAERRQLARAPVGTTYIISGNEGLSLAEIFEQIHAGKNLGPLIAGATRTELAHHKFSNVKYLASTVRYRELELSFLPRDPDDLRDGATGDDD